MSSLFKSFILYLHFPKCTFNSIFTTDTIQYHNTRCPSAEYYPWVRAISDLRPDWQKNSMGTVLQRTTWGFWWRKRLTWANTEGLHSRWHQKEEWSAGRGRWFYDTMIDSMILCYGVLIYRLYLNQAIKSILREIIFCLFFS